MAELLPPYNRGMTTFLVLCLVAALVWCASLTVRLSAVRAGHGGDGKLSNDRTREMDSQVREQAVVQERERIYSDLHDDLGAKLLTLIYRAESPVQADLARAILQDLRDVVTRSRGTPGTLADVLADIRSEAMHRLAAVGLGLDWDDPGDLPDPLLDTGDALHLHRIVREAISNTIRHAQARHLRIRVRAREGELLLELTDDGSGVSNEVPLGSGMRNMRNRADELEGSIDWLAGTQGGAKVLLRMPLASSG